MINRKTHFRRRVFSLAGPMLIVGISTPMLGMVDTAVVGHLSQPYYLGAIAIGAMIFNFLFWSFGFFRMGTTGLVAKAVGESKQTELTLVLVRGLILASFFGLLLILISPILSSIIFSTIETTENVLVHAEQYFAIRIWAAPATLCTYVLLGWFLGLSKPKLNLIIVILINALNIILDVIFVVWLDLNSLGVAWATLISEYIGLMVGLFIVYRVFKHKLRPVKVAILLDVNAIKQYLSVNFNVFLRTLFLLIAFTIFTLQGAKHGELILAANVILMNLQTFMAYVLDSIAHAIEVLVGKYFHGNKKEYLRQVLIISGQWSIVVALLFSLFYLFFGEYVIMLLTGIDEVKNLTMTYLPWLIISPLISVWSYWYDGVFIGANLVKQMRDTMLVSLLLFLISWQLLLPLGNHGLWAALMIFMLARGISMSFAAYKNIIRPLYFKV